MAIFDRLDRMISRTTDRVFSVQFELMPMRSSPNGRPGADPTRAIERGRGILDESPVYAPVENGARDRRGNDLKALITGADIVFSVDKSHFRTAEPQQGDKIQIDRERIYEIVAVRNSGARFELQLTKG